MELSAVRHITTSDGNVIQIDRNGQMLWRGLPSGLTAVEYIAGNNSAYIHTGIRLTDLDTVYGKFLLTSASNVFGCFTSSSSSDNFSFYTGSGTAKLYARMDGKLDSTGTSVTGEQIDVVMDKTGLWINDIQKASFSNIPSFTASADFYIGWLANSSAAKIVGRIYSLEILGKFLGLPARRDTDDEYGLYDFVSRQFLTSDSSTGFTGGEPV